MNSFKNHFITRCKQLAKDESGQDLVEYALLVAMIAVAVAATFPSTIAPSISSIFSRIQSSFTASNNVGS